MKRSIPRLTLAFVFVLYAWALNSYAGYAKPQLGTYLGELDDGLREKMGYQGQGILVHGLVKGSGAEKSGLAKDDIILEFDNRKIVCVQDLVNAVKQTNPGDKIKVKLFRKGKTLTIPVEITEKTDWIGFAPPHKWVHFKSDRPYVGIRIQELNPQLAEYFKTRSGILITKVTEKSPGHEADLRAGDVIIAWQDEEISDSGKFYEHLNNSKEGDKISLRILRHGKELEKEVILREAKRQETYGFHINRDDTGDLVFRMGNKEYPAHLDIPMPEIDLDLQDLKDTVKGLRDGLGSYQEELKKLRDELRELKEDVDSLKGEKKEESF